MRRFLSNFVFLVIGNEFAVGFAGRRLLSFHSSLSATRNHGADLDVTNFNRTLYSQDGGQNRNTTRGRRERTWIDRASLGSTQEFGSNNGLQTPPATFQALQRLTRVQDIDEWMQSAVRGEHLMTFGDWNVNSQIEFIKVLQHKRAYESIMMFLRHLERPHVKVYTTAMFAMAISSHDRHRALEILDWMDEREVQPTSLTFIALLGSVDGPAMTTRTMKRIESYQRVQLSAEVFNSAIYACRRRSPARGASPTSSANDWQTALNLLQAMRRKRIQPTVKTYRAILQVLSGTGQVSMAKSILQQLQSSPGLKPDDRVWAAAINVCAEAGDYNGAIHFINDMNATGYRPNLLHCSGLLQAFALSGQDEMALQALAMMTAQEGQTDNLNASFSFYLPPISPDLIALNTCIAACAKSGNIAAALSIADRMKEGEFRDPGKGGPISPDLISYNNILRFCEEPEAAKQIIKEMRLSRRKRHGVVLPSSVSYAHAINVCQRANAPDVHTARTLLEWALDDGVQPTVYMFAAAIWAAQKSGDRTAALDLFLQMEELGCPPNTVAYNGVISALCDSGDVEHAILIYEEMKGRGMSLSASVFKRLALAIQAIGLPEERQQCLERVVSLMDTTEKTVKIGGRIFEALICVYGTRSLVDKALTTFRAITGRVDGPCLRAILLACSLAAPPRWEDAVSILHTSDIVEDSLGPGKVDQIALGNAIICCCKANEFDEALTLLQLYGRKNSDRTQRLTSLSVASMNSLIAACGRGQRPDLALEVLGTMESRYGVRPDSRSFRNAAIACNKAQHDQIRLKMPPSLAEGVEWWECSLSLMRRMREDGLIPDVATFSATISACEAAGEWQRALGVLQAMMDDENNLEGDETLLNLYCFNAAISACEKGEAWVEALELYERMLDIDGPIRPNAITLNSLLVALENAGQKDLARSKYDEGRKLKIVNPWRRTKTIKGESVRAMDLHRFSGAMAKAAVRSFMDGYSLRTDSSNETVGDLLIICGKGLHSEKDPILQGAVLSVLSNEYGVKAEADETNPGRVIVDGAELRGFVSRSKW